MLKSLGADVIAVPCITAHYFHLELETGLGVRILHAIRDCSDLLKESGVTNVGLMATEGTVSTGLYHADGSRSRRAAGSDFIDLR